GSERQAITASSPVGVATPSSATWKARRTTSSSRAAISSLTKMCAASLLKYPTLLWGQKSFACGHARLRHVTAAAGSKRSAERGLRKLSCSSKTERRTSRVNRRTMGGDRKSTRLNSSHGSISYAVFCLKKKKTQHQSARVLT